MSLISKIDTILNFINSKQSLIDFNQTIFKILEGDLISYVKDSLRKQLISDSAFNSAAEGISPINIIKQVTDKLTKLYAGNTVRTAYFKESLSKTDQEVVDYYVRNLNVNKFFNNFNYFLNSTKMSLIEPYLTTDNIPKLRVIPPHQFLVYSDDPIEPNTPTVLIKFMGQKIFNDKMLDVYFLYSKDEFIAINAEGELIDEYMKKNNGLNIYKEIPAIYGNVSDYQLLPTSDTDLLQMGKLIPLMFTHSNDAIKFMSYSIVYGIDVDSENLERNPNVFWVFKSDSERTPQIGQIKPEVDTTKVIENIMVQLDAWLETKGIKVSSAGRVRTDNSLSGVSLMIKEMDTIQALKNQSTLLAECEVRFWRMMAKVHNYWLKNGIVKNLPLMNESVYVKIDYELPRPIESENERLDRAIKAKNNFLVTTKGALKIWDPNLTEKEIDFKVSEIENEYRMMEVSSADQQSDGESKYS